MIVNILSPWFDTPNSSSFLFPLIIFRNHCEELNINIKIFFSINKKISDCDFLLIDSKYFKFDWIKNKNKILDIFQQLSEHTKVIYFDTTDSAGTIDSSLLPIVYSYAKNQIYSDLDNYTKRLYGRRLFTDYYNKKFHIIDKSPEYSEPVVTKSLLKKLKVSWNIGLSNYSFYSKYILKIMDLSKKTPICKYLVNYPKLIRSSFEKRKNLISARFNSSYGRKTVGIQRNMIINKLKNKIHSRPVNRKNYFFELCNSKIVLSPFGWGEINLKDFEVFLTGGLLFKPKMNHIKTWPNFFINKKTIVEFGWDLDNLNYLINFYNTSDNQRLDIANEGQKMYLRYTSGKDAGEFFANHLMSILKND